MSYKVGILTVLISISSFAVAFEGKVIDLEKNEKVNIRIHGCETTEFPFAEKIGNAIEARCHPVTCNIYKVSNNSPKRAILLIKSSWSHTSSVPNSISCFNNREDAVSVARALVGIKCKKVILKEHSSSRSIFKKCSSI